MKTRVEKACDTCGYRCFAKYGTIVCPGAPHAPDCKGTLCAIVTPLPGKRVSGVLVRDRIKHTSIFHEIHFLPNARLSNMNLLNCGRWQLDFSGHHGWTTKQWKEQYGKLPRKGSKSMIIIELVSNGK